jgi:hypothetical protein
MNQVELASAILSFRRCTPNLSAVRETLGESYGEAFNRGWLVPDYDTGMINVTSDRTRIEEMETLAATVPAAPAEQACCESWRAFGPARTNLLEVIVENDASVGDDVVVAENGKSFNGVVKSIKPDGTYEVSFAGEKPAKTSFTTEELKVSKRGDKASESPIGDVPPAKPAVTNAGVLPVPGVG